MARDRYIKQSLGSSLYSRIQESRVLLVGAGGIGCELLKNLVLTGFGEVHIVDLDTIDLSNLNRQFLFGHQHIKKPKALVAKETASKFNPNIKLFAHHSNIKDSNFNVEWYTSFDIVFNALDNLDARRHVNKMCLAARVPLIESGTTGFNGQVQVILQGKTECYDCNEKETPKTFPVCTIRSTPSQPIHCIVWAKSYLFTEIFGTSEDDAADLDHTEDSENASEIEKLREEANALKNIRQSMGSDEFARNIFEKVFNLDIIRLRSMEDMWKNRDKPDALSYDKLAVEPWISDLSVAPRDQKAWTLEENFAVFMDSIHRLSKRLQAAQAESSDIDKPPILAFDKDDADTLDFVASTANLRSIVFGIPTSSKFDIKQMAGNIIPAIATTNAMTASLCVLQSFKVIKGQLEKAKMVYLECLTDRVVSSGKLLPPKPECSVCSVTQARLLVDTSRATLHDLVEDFLRLELGYGEEFSVNNEVGTLYDPEDNENLPKMLSELGIKGDSFLTIIDDDEENPRVNLVLSITDKSLPQESKPVCAPEKFEVARKPKTSISPTPDGLPNGHTNGATKNDATLKVNGNAEGHTNGNTETNGVTKKRKLSQSSVVEETNPAKRGKVKEAAILIIDDDGSIMID